MLGAENPTRICGLLGPVLLVAFVLSATFGAPEDDWLSRTTFDDLDRRYQESPAARVEDGAGLAWGRSYALMAYVAMHRATGEVAYLRQLLQEGEAIAALRDDRREPPLQDVIRGRVGWGRSGHGKTSAPPADTSSADPVGSRPIRQLEGDHV